jgi:CHAT domain-containing protein
MELPFSLNEIDYDRSRKFIGSMATKDQFLQNYRQFKILHLATHASLGKDSSSNWIQFFPDSSSSSSGRLYVHEIYNLQLSANDLVILSACETGSGLTVGGEGLLSVSRAFMYAGAEGIISTLYKTDDRVTAFIMKRLAHYLQNGKSPEDALRLSKIDLIKSDEMNHRVKSPNYWSNFVYIGKIGHAGHEKRRWFVFIAFLGLPLLFWLYRIKNKPSVPA